MAAALYYQLKKDGLTVSKQIEIPVKYDETLLDISFKLDLLVEHKVIIELKSVEELAPIHYKQLSTYLRLTKKKLGLLVNFNTLNILDDIKRIANKV